jgi:GNAT superfamily N-acetyltransferase
MEIKKASISDLDQLVRLFEAYRNFYGMPPDNHSAREFLRERILKNESEIFIAIDSDEKQAGFVQLYPVFSSTRMKRLWLLNDLFVDESYRGKGVSKLLLERAKQLCRETNACAMLLETAKSNVTGNALYPRSGFVLDEEHNYYTWQNN